MYRMMKQCRVVFVFALVCCLSSVAWAGNDAYLFDVLKKPVYRAAWDAMFRGEKDIPVWLAEWADKSAGPTSPCKAAVVNEIEYMVHFVCKAHECGDNLFIVFFAPGGKQAWGVLTTDSERFFGKPDELMRYALLDARRCE